MRFGTQLHDRKKKLDLGTTSFKISLGTSQQLLFQFSQLITKCTVSQDPQIIVQNVFLN